MDVETIEKTVLRKPTTRKGKKILEAREPKEIEGPRQTLFMKGTKTSESVQGVLKDFYELKKLNSVTQTQKLLDKPFESTSQLEHFCNKRDCALFAIGNHSKKRPNNLILGRIFDGTVLDIVEFGIDNYVPLNKALEIGLVHRPMLVFEGDVFEFHSNFMRLKNLLQDFFVENIEPKTFDLKDGVHHIMSISGCEKTNSIHIRNYEVKSPNIKQMEKDAEGFEPHITPIGLTIDLTIRRTRYAKDDVYKVANRQMKRTKTKAQKAITNDPLGQKRGRVFLERQNIGDMPLAKRKKLKQAVKAEQAQKKAEEISKIATMNEFE